MFDAIATQPISLTPTGSNNYPRLVTPGDGSLYAFWQRFVNEEGDTIVVRRLDGRAWGDEFPVSEDRGAFRPRAASRDGQVWVAWSSYQGDAWDVYARQIEGAGERPLSSQVVPVSTAGQDHHCDIAIDRRQRVWLAWQSARRERFAVHARCLSDDSADGMLVADEGENYRPSIAASDTGDLWFLYEGFRDGRYDIYCRRLRGDGSWSDETRVSTSDTTWSADPVVVSAEAGVVWAAWYEMGAERHVSYRLRQWDGQRWGPEHEVATFLAWHATTDIIPDAKGGVWVAVRNHLVHFDGADFGPMYLCTGDNYCRRATAVADDGKLIVAWQRSPRGDHCSGFVDNREGEIWIRRVDPEADLKAEQRPTGPASPVVTSQFNDIVQPDPALGEWNLYWGDIHGQIMFSDGLGSPDHFYNYEKSISHLDFGAVTDHSAFPDKLTDSEFEIIRHVTNLMNEPGRFATLVAYEWSGNEWKERVGHKNVYFPGAGGPCYRICDPESDTADKLFARAREWGALAPPHHVDCNWRPDVVTADTDWRYHDPQAVPVTEICSHHGVSEYYGNPRAHPGQSQGRSVQDGLARGYRMGFIASSDTHEMMPGQDGGVVAVLAKELTRDAVFDAIRNRRCYASTAPRVRIDFRVNGALMGSEISSGERRVISATVAAPCPILRLDVVKNNQNIHGLEPGADSAEMEFVDVGSGRGADYYYLRVTMPGDQFAWSSPVWVDPE